jgi:hypothetical protein
MRIRAAHDCITGDHTTRAAILWLHQLNRSDMRIEYTPVGSTELNLIFCPNLVPEWSADALLDLQRLYREGKASRVTNDVERLTGRKPLTFDQFVTDYAFAFQAEAKVAS